MWNWSIWNSPGVWKNQCNKLLPELENFDSVCYSEYIWAWSNHYTFTQSISLTCMSSTCLKIVYAPKLWWGVNQNGTWYFPEPSSELSLSSEIDEDSEGMSKYLIHIYTESWRSLLSICNHCFKLEIWVINETFLLLSFSEVQILVILPPTWLSNLILSSTLCHCFGSGSHHLWPKPFRPSHSCLNCLLASTLSFNGQLASLLIFAKHKYDVFLLFENPLSYPS